MLRENGRKFETVTYINSTAAVKALSDWVVTSGNAEQIIRRVPADCEILFVPDRHLGQYLQEVTGRKMILWNGACMVHEIFSVGDLLALKRELPHALTLAHPECPSNIREHSDFVGGTEGMIQYVGKFAEPHDFLVATEANMMWQLQSKFPRHRYHPVPGITCACNKCPHMGRNTLEKLRDCLATGTPEIRWQPEFTRAREVVERSLLN
jgi:quinolinate synthase